VIRCCSRPRLRPRKIPALGWAKGVKPKIARRGTEHGSGLGLHRYVVERTIALLHWFRRLRIRWEIRDDIHEAFMTPPPPSSAGAASSTDHSAGDARSIARQHDPAAQPPGSPACAGWYDIGEGRPRSWGRREEIQTSVTVSPLT
jgi:hypothetical protein